MSEKCPYRQGENPYWCLLAEKGHPLTNEQIDLRIRLMSDQFTTGERLAFMAGVRFAEKAHGVTG